MTKAVSLISAEEIPFDTIKREQRQSFGDSRALIWIDVDAVGFGCYRAIINGSAFELPEGLPTIHDAKRVACEIAIKELTVAVCEIIKTAYK